MATDTASHDRPSGDAAEQTEQLFLFVSNVRPLNTRDLLALLAAPRDMPLLFRNTDVVLNERAQESWSDLPGTRVLVHLSLQDEHEYQDSVYIPLRTGIVSRTSIEGTRRFLEICPQHYVQFTSDKFPSDEARRAQIRGYRAFLESAGVDTPYSHYVSLSAADPFAPDVGLTCSTNESMSSVFEHACTSICKTSTFRNTRFYRVIGLCERGKHSNMITLDPDAGVYRLTAGRTYDLIVYLFQPQDMDHVEYLRVSSDEDLIRLPGRTRLLIASGYDRYSIPVHVPPLTAEPFRDTVIGISPEEHVSGADLQLPIRVETPAVDRYGSAALSAAALTLIGVPSLVPDASVAAKLVALATGVSVLAGLRLRGARTAA